MRYPFMRRTLLLVLILFLCGGRVYASSISRHGGQLILSTTSDPKTFNPIVASETSSTAMTAHIFEGLTTLNADTLQVEPHLAQSWEVSDDGLQWTFKLRQDVQWHDGRPFTADDVVFTFNELIYNPNVPNSASDTFTIDGQKFLVEKVDTYAVRFTLPVKFAPFLMGMGQSILPRHRLAEAVLSGDFNFTWGIDADLEDIVGTGPFQLAAYHPGERIIFKRNNRYWKRSEFEESLPYLDGLIYLIVQNADTALLKFIDGELDYYGLRGTDFPMLKPLEESRNFTIYEAGADFGTNFIVFNQNLALNSETEKPFVDPVKTSWFRERQFRRAVAHAIDKTKMIDIVMNGLGYPQESAMSPSAGFFYNEDTPTYAYDLNKAQQILHEAGFIDRDGNGILEDVEGHEVMFNLYTNAGGQERIQIASIIRHDLEVLGMKVNFQALEFNILVNKLMSTFDWHAIIIGLTGGIEPHFGKNVWDSSGQLHMWYPKQKEPSTDWEGRIDAIFNQAVQELDPQERKVLYDEHQTIVAQELPFIYTVLGSNIFAVRNKFGNLRPRSYGGAFHNIEEVYIRPEGIGGAL